ncbi:hypothetical protein QBC39DRAFT_376568 [Podospora conica]|nr:hypothetical protein QBC39DRAFT_376568 [Schizothecium conicum]
MCPTNSPLNICGASIGFYRQRRRTSIRFCIETKATILFTAAQDDMLPAKAHHPALRSFLAKLGRLCHLEHGPEFANIVHGQFRDLVYDYVLRLAPKTGICVHGPDGVYTWNQALLAQHFQSVGSVGQWLRAHGAVEPWEQMGTAGPSSNATVSAIPWHASRSDGEQGYTFATLSAAHHFAQFRDRAGM